jgi:hypothetical protein
MKARIDGWAHWPRLTHAAQSGFASWVAHANAARALQLEPAAHGGSPAAIRSMSSRSIQTIARTYARRRGFVRTRQTAPPATEHRPHVRRHCVRIESPSTVPTVEVHAVCITAHLTDRIYPYARLPCARPCRW